eukprot:scaffold492_cov257-Pinguiococcus_pyrenoidosus.AAC.2
MSTEIRRKSSEKAGEMRSFPGFSSGERREKAQKGRGFAPCARWNCHLAAEVAASSAQAQERPIGTRRHDWWAVEKRQQARERGAFPTAALGVAHL